MYDTKTEIDEISIKEMILKAYVWIKYLISRWIILAAALIVGAIVGYVYVSTKVPTYKAECTFVMEGSSAASSQISGMASMLGIDIASGSSGMFQGEGLLALYSSRLMVEKTLFSNIQVKDTVELLIDRFVRINNIADNWAAVPVKDQRKTISNIVKDISKNYLKIQARALVSVSVVSKDEIFSKEFTEKLVENVNSFYIESKIKKSQGAITILQRQADSVQHVLNNSMSGVASALDANPNANVALQILRVPSKKREIDVQATAAIYTEVMRNLEATRMALRRETPLIQIIDRPVYPLDSSVPSKMMFTIWGGVIFAFLSVVCLTLLFVYKRIIS